MESLNCLLCGEDDYIVVFSNKNDVYKRRIGNLTFPERQTRFVGCRSCGLVYQSPRLESEILGEMYRENFRTIPPERHSPPDIEMQAEWILLNIENVERGKVFDVGCGTGSLLNHFKKRGWETFGVEPTVTYAEYGTRENGHKIKADIYGDGIFEGEKFDLLIISHVIEHVPNPIEMLISLKGKMKESGYLYIGTPNVTEPRIGMHDIFSCQHLYLFSHSSLANLIHKAGFEVKASRRLGTRKGIDMLLQNGGSGGVEFLLIDNPLAVRKIINSFRLKMPFLEARTRLRNFYKSFYKAWLRRPFKRFLVFLFGERMSARFFS